MGWDVIFATILQGFTLARLVLRWGVLAPLVFWPSAFWTRAWPLLRRQKWAVLLLVPGFWATGMVGLVCLLGLLPQAGVCRHLAAPVVDFLQRNLDALLIEVVLPNWLLHRPNLLVRLALLWAWSPLVCTLFGSPVYLAAVLLKNAALSPDHLFGWGKKSLSRTFGSAFMAANDQGEGWLTKAGPRALLVGGHETKKTIFYGVSGHVLTCAPTGAGKGIGCVLPNLWTYPGSVFCLDIKGENYLRTAAQRKKAGHHVWLVDPFGVTKEPGASLNWLSGLDGDNEDAVSQAAGLAEAMVVRTPGTESYWDDAAVSLLQGLLLEAAAQKGGGVAQVRAWLTGPPPELTARLEQMAQAPARAWGLVARAANGFLAKADKERSGVLSTAQRHTAFLDDPRLLRALQVNGPQKAAGLSLESFLERPTTLYFVLPPDKLTAYNRFARVSLVLLLQALVKRGLRPQEDTLLLLDEFAQLGYFPPIEEGLSMLRGYGASIWCLVQDLSQLQAVYPKWRSFVANSHLQFFGVQDVETARYVSELLGQRTVRVENTGEARSWGQDQTSSSSANESSSETGRPLLTPDEVRRLDSDQVLFFERGQAPRQLKRLDATHKDQLDRLATFAQTGRPPAARTNKEVALGDAQSTAS